MGRESMRPAIKHHHDQGLPLIVCRRVFVVVDVFVLRMSEGHAFLAGWAFCVNYIFCTATGQTVPAIPGSSSLPPDLERASLEFINEWLEDIRYGSATVDPAEALPIPPTEYPQVPLELPGKPVDPNHDDELTNEQMAEDILQYYSANNAELEETPANVNVNEDLEWPNDLEPDYHTSASANTIEEFGWFAPILDELADACVSPRLHYAVNPFECSHHLYL